MSVAAVERHAGGLRVAPFSNTQPLVAAPGVAVRSAGAGTDGLVSRNGTSMAVPHVTGVAALWWEKLRQEGWDDTTIRDQVIARLSGRATTDPFEGTPPSPRDVGNGLVQAP